MKKSTNMTDRTNHSGHAQINNRSMQNSPGMRIPNDEYNKLYQDPQLQQQLIRPVAAQFPRVLHKDLMWKRKHPNTKL